jgi:hypothetical protein
LLTLNPFWLILCFNICFGGCCFLLNIFVTESFEVGLLLASQNNNGRSNIYDLLNPSTSNSPGSSPPPSGPNNTPPLVHNPSDSQHSNNNPQESSAVPTNNIQTAPLVPGLTPQDWQSLAAKLRRGVNLLIENRTDNRAIFPKDIPNLDNRDRNMINAYFDAKGMTRHTTLYGQVVRFSRIDTIANTR